MGRRFIGSLSEPINTMVLVTLFNIEIEAYCLLQLRLGSHIIGVGSNPLGPDINDIKLDILGPYISIIGSHLLGSDAAGIWV